MPYLSIALPQLSAVVVITLMRSADVSDGLEVEVAGAAEVAAGADGRRDTSLAFASNGCLLTWLTTPPVEPRPNSIDAEPRSSSMRSKLKTSRS